jgi:8-oxo-dGTP diphosphatase
LDLTPVKKPLHHVALALVHRESRWLVARRPDGVHLAGLWEFPGGKVHPGESHVDAALRELEEECGVRAVAQRVLGAFHCEYDDRCVSLTPVVCAWVSGEARPLGSAECRWARLSELRELEMPAINRELLRELEQHA